MGRLHGFLFEKNPAAAKRAVKAIREGVKSLSRHPQMGRPLSDPDDPDQLPAAFRELVIEFGSGAYVVLYHLSGREVVLVGVKHGREAGY
jgi:plasmid stabilization system protein ParE